MVIVSPLSEKCPADQSVDLSSEDEEYKPRFVYQHRNGSVELHLASLECLENTSYLKDNIIQFYSAYLLNEKCNQSTAARVHIFDSIFSGQLLKVFDKTRVDGGRLAKLRKWYDGTDLFRKDFIVLPFCSGDHWFAIVACYPRNVESFPPGGLSTRTDGRTPCLIVLDSLGLSGKGHLEHVMDMLDFEWRAKCSTVKRFSHSDLAIYRPHLPKQANAYDCGLYMLTYIECFLEDPDSFCQAVKSKPTERQLRKKVETFLAKNTRDALLSLINKVCKHV